MIEALIVIGGLIGVAAVGLFVSGRMTKWWTSAVYALMTAALGVLMVSGYYALDASSSIAVLWYARMAAISVVVALGCLFFLIQELIDDTRVDVATRLMRIIVACGSLIVLVLSFTPLVFQSAFTSSLSARVSIEPGIGVLFYVLYVVGVLVLISFQMADEARAVYARRYGALDMRYVVSRTISYVLSLLAIGVIFVTLSYGLSWIFVSTRDANVVFTPVGVFSALVVALIFHPIKRRLNPAIDRLMYKENYSIPAFSIRVSQTLNSTNDLRTLLERTAELIASTVKSSQTFFYVNLPEDRYMTAGTEHHSRVSASEFADLEEGAREIPKLISEYDVDHPIHRMMASHRLGLVLPLYKNDVLVGYLCLGRSQKGGYTNRDVRALKVIVDEVTIAIQNALSVDEVRKLNDTLEQRINSATHELRASNAQLQRLDEAKDEFISMASHQLRTPLTSIKGYISMLLEGDAGKINKDQKHFLNEAFVSSERMVRLIGDFLNVSRLQTGKFVIEKHPVDLARLVQREIEGLEQNAASRGITFVYKKPKDIPVLNVDENKIQQVIMNFADNAIYYSKDKSKITVTLKKVGGFVEFKVTDTGIGVPKAEQEHLFNKFFRATNARKARPDGTGVGLFLARKVVTDHHGTIIFESKEGKGSTFGFRLPVPHQSDEN